MRARKRIAATGTIAALVLSLAPSVRVFDLIGGGNPGAGGHLQVHPLRTIMVKNAKLRRGE